MRFNVFIYILPGLSDPIKPSPAIMPSSKLRRFNFLSATLFGILGLARAATSAECCALVSQLSANMVFMPNTFTYATEQADFWSSTEQLSPSCVFFPDTPEKVAEAVSLFVQNDCKWSIKGGGHSAIPGAANIHHGILMPMERLKRFDISDDKKTVVVGAGNLMGDIYEGLDPHNLTAMIGRYQQVGLGVAVGAGFSYLVNENGLAVDNVINYEVVLANATIVNANATDNPDLFRALKGGSNNFGVVTAFTFLTVSTEGSVYGGILYYNESYLDRVSDVIYDYHVRFNPIAYNKAVNAFPEIFQGWLDIPTYGNTVHNRQYYDLSVELENGFPNGLVQEQRVFTVYADAQLYKDLWAHFHVWCQGYQHIPGFYGLHVNMPITARAVHEGINKGGNILGLEGAGNRTLGTIYFGVSFNNLEDIEEVLPAHDEFVKSMIALAESRGLLHRYIVDTGDYSYSMLTYSGFDQPVIESYGPENMQKIVAVQDAYDPDRVFQRLVPGGQKIPVPT
ncbi:hypothetical protein E0Z10_g10942 [Xylaria hypoxylon]|uniref:FAD-binding PCMH-type domain-containing protein n=1 Tax=Xylaria hypoxylon TaxID=37992 RepID=A0A4Z0Y9E0_9PEZI|nr:hypothetical protein E0Z10_g10942 [Xylaria hypoxylon]